MATKSAPKSEPADKDDSGGKTSTQSKSKPVLLIVAVLFAMIAAGAGGWFISHKSAAKAETAEADAEAENEDNPDSEDQAKTKDKKSNTAKGKANPNKPPIFANMDAFTVNLQRDETDHYLQLTLAIKVGEPATVDAVKPYTPQLRNNILLLLSSKHAKELESTEAKQKLAADITAIAKMSVTPAIAEDISGVFFTTFLIQ